MDCVHAKPRILVAVAETLKTSDENHNAFTVIDIAVSVFGWYESCKSVAVTTENMVPNFDRLERFDAAYSCESRMVGIPAAIRSVAVEIIFIMVTDIYEHRQSRCYDVHMISNLRGKSVNISLHRTKPELTCVEDSAR